MILVFFDYIFYRVCSFYSGTSDSNSEGSACCIVAVVQGMNIITCFFLYVLITQHKLDLNKYIGGGIMFVLLVLNYIRYIYKENRNYKILKAKWAHEPKKDRNRYIVALYILLSFGLCFGLAIYLGSKR